MMKLVESLLFELKEVPGLRFLERYWYQVSLHRSRAINKSQELRAKVRKFSHGTNAIRKTAKDNAPAARGASANDKGTPARSIGRVPRNVKGSKKR